MHVVKLDIAPRARRAHPAVGRRSELTSCKPTYRTGAAVVLMALLGYAPIARCDVHPIDDLADYGYHLTVPADGQPYWANGYLDVPAGSTLVIDPGVVIQFPADAGLTVEGRVEANGTADQRIVFTSDQATKAPAQWDGTTFAPGASGEFRFCRMEAGGANYSDYIDMDRTVAMTIEDCEFVQCGNSALWVFVQDTDPSHPAAPIVVRRSLFDHLVQVYWYMEGWSAVAPGDGVVDGPDNGPMNFVFDNNTISNSGVLGHRAPALVIYGPGSNSTVQITNNVFEDNLTGIDADDYSPATMGPLTITGNEFRNHETAAIRGRATVLAYANISGNTFSVTTGFNGELMSAGVLRAGAARLTMPGTDQVDSPVPCRVVEGSATALIVPAGAALAVDAGVILQFSRTFLGIQVSGQLDATGTSTSSVVFTSSAVSKAPGQWKGIWFNRGSRGTLNFCRVEYGGAANEPLLRLDPSASATVQDSWVQYASRTGVSALTDTTTSVALLMDRCHLVGNQANGVLNTDPALLVGATSGRSPVFAFRDGEVRETGPAAARQMALSLLGNMSATQVVVTGNTFQNNYATLSGDLPAITKVTLGGNTSTGNTYAGIILTGGTLTTSGTLWGAGETYRVTGSPVVSATATLYVAPGAQLKMGSGINWQVYGVLNAVGTLDQTIQFTSAQATPAVGDWDGINFLGGATGNLEYCRLAYASGPNSYVTIQTQAQAALTLKNSIIEQAQYRSLFIYDSPAGTEKPIVLTGNIFQDIHPGVGGAQWPGMQVGNGSGRVNLTFTGNTIQRTGPGSGRLPGLQVVGGNLDPAKVTISGNTFSSNHEGILGGVDAVSRVTLGGNSYSGNSYHDGIVIAGGTTVLSGTLTLDGAPYLFTSGPTVAAGTTLFVVPGVTMKMVSGASLRLTVNGMLSAVGTPSQMITFTSAATSPAPGDWDGINFVGGSTGDLEYCRLSYGSGPGGYVTIQTQAQAALTLKNSIIEQAQYRSLVFFDSTAGMEKPIVVTGNIFQDTHPGVGGAQWSGMQVGNGSGRVNLTFTENTIQRTGPASGRLPGMQLQGGLLPGQVLIQGNTFADNSIGVTYGDDLGGATVSGNTFGLHATAAIQGGLGGIAKSIIAVPTANIFTYTPTGFVAINGGSLSGTGTLYGVASPYLMVTNTTPSVAAGATLYVTAGAEIRGSTGSVLGVTGRMEAAGTSGNEITFTSTPPGGRKATGQWGSIHFYSRGTGDLSNVRIEYGGGGADPGMVTASNGCVVAMHQCTVQRAKGIGFYLSSGGSGTATILIEDSTFTNNCQSASTDWPAIQFNDPGGPWARVTMQRTTVQQTGPTNAQPGMRLLGNLAAGGVLIQGNTFQGNSSGILFYSEDVAAATTLGNTFSGNADAIHGPLNSLGHSVFGSSTPDVMSGNTFDGIAIDGGNFRPTGGLSTGTLYADGSAPYRILYTPQISAGGTLFVAPGVTIQSALNQGLYVAAQGGLMALGTPEDPVVFTSTPTADKKAPGQWSQLWFEDKSVNALQNCIIEYGGSTGSMAYANSGALGSVTVVRGARMRMSGTTVRSGYRNGVYVSSTGRSGVAPVLDIQDCTFTGNAQGASAGDGLAQGGVRVGEPNGGPVVLTFAGNQVLSNGTTSARRDGLLFYSALSASLATVSGNTFSGNNSGVRFMPDDDQAGVTLDGNTFTGNVDAIHGSLNSLGRSVFGYTAADMMTGNGFDGIAIDGGNFRTTGGVSAGTLYADGSAPYRIVAIPQISAGGVLWVAPGVTIQSNLNQGLRVASQGTLMAVGMAGNPVVFTSTSTSDQKAAGQWGSIRFESGGIGAFDNCTVEYGGGDASYPALITVNPGSVVSIQNSLLRRSKRMAVQEVGGWTVGGTKPSLVLTSSTLMENEQAAVTDEPAVMLGSDPCCYDVGGRVGQSVLALLQGNVIQNTGASGSLQPGIRVVGSVLAADAVIARNLFSGNRIGVLFGDDLGSASLSGNVFSGNTREAVKGGLNSIGRSAFDPASPNVYSGPGGIQAVVIDGGNLLSGDGLLSLGGSPYRFRNTPLVSARKLTVAPGVTLQGESAATFAVASGGVLNAVGTQGQHILITSTSTGIDPDLKGPGQWGTLRFDAGSAGQLSFCDIEYGGGGTGPTLVSVGQGSTVTIQSCLLRRSARMALQEHGAWGPGAPKPVLTIVSSTLMENQQVPVSADEPALQLGDDLCCLDVGGRVGQPVIATVQGNVIRDTGPIGARRPGVRFMGTSYPGDVFLENNLITTNRVGVLFGDTRGGATIRCNTILGSDTGIQLTGTQVGTVMTSNYLGTDVGTTNTLNLQNTVSTPVFPAMRNWWGTSDPASLRVLGGVCATPILGSYTPVPDPGASRVDPVALDGKVHLPSATVYVVFDRLMTSAIEIKTLRTSDSAVFPTVGSFQSDGRTWRGLIGNETEGLQNGRYQVIAVSSAACNGQTGVANQPILTFDVYLKPPPDPPQNLIGSTPDNKIVVLTWSPSGSPDVVKYRVRRVSQTGGLVVVAELSSTLATFSFFETPPTGLPDQLDYSVASVDTLGQESVPVSVSITLDNTAPVITISVGTPKYQGTGGLYVIGATPVAVTATDPSGVASLTYNIDGGSFAALQGGVVTFAGLPDASHTLTVLAEDALGNKASPSILNVIVDNTPPSATMLYGPSSIYVSGGTNFIKGNRQIIITANDPGSGLVSITGNGQTLAGSPAYFNGFPSAGDATFTFSAKDKLNNVTPDVTVAFKVITTPPTSTVLTDPAKTYVSGGNVFVRADTAITLSAASDVPSGIAGLGWSFRNATLNWGWGSIGNTPTVTQTVPSNMPDGSFFVDYNSADRVGNTEPVKTATFILDRSAPDAPGVAPATDVYLEAGKKYAEPPFAFSLPASDRPTTNASGIMVISYTITGAVDGAILATGQTTDPTEVFTFNPPPDGSLAIRITYMATDHLNQVTVAPPFDVTLTTAPPRLSVMLDPLVNTFVNGTETYLKDTVTVTIQGSKMGPGGGQEAVSMEYRVDRPEGTALFAYVPKPTPWALPAFGGTETLERDQHDVLVYREAEKDSTRKSLRLYVDSVAPSVTLIPPATASGFVAANAAFLITATDFGSGVKVGGLSLNQTGGTTFTATNATFTLGSPDRQVQLVARAADNVGNIGDSGSPLALSVDGTPPVTLPVPVDSVTVTGGQNYALSPWSFTIQSVDGSGAGVKPASTVVKDNNLTITPTGGVFTIRGTGVHTLTFSSQDNVGNQESAKSYVVTLLADLPQPPLNVVAAAASSTSIRVTWSPPAASTGINVYRLMRMVGGVETLVVTIPATSPRDFAVTGLTPGQSETFVLRSVDTLGRVSGSSTPATAVPTVLPPVISQPTNRATITSYSLAVVGSAETSSTILVGIGGDVSLEMLGPVDQSGSFHLVKIFGQEGTWDLYFVARIGNVTSLPTVRTITVDTPPPVPQGLTAIALDTRVRLTWARNTEADVTKYNVYRDGNLVPLLVVTQPTSGGLQIEDLALTNGRKYRYQVEAVDVQGHGSGLSGAVEVIPAAGPEWEP